MSGPLIYYIRHGETDWNAEFRYQGQQDIPLNEKGRSQAAHNGEKLARVLGKAEGFQFISSPLGRATETMEIIRGKMQLPARDYATDKRLIEVCYGEYEGVTQAEFKAKDRELYYERKNNMWTFRPKGGESHADIIGRISSWHNDLDPQGKYVVTAHGAVGRVTRHLLAGISVEEVARFVFPQDRIFVFSEQGEEVI